MANPTLAAPVRKRMLVALMLPPDTTLDYTGLPQVAASTPYEIRGHNVAVRVEGDTYTVESTTEYRNHGDAGTAIVLVPRRRSGDSASGQPTFTVEATWDKKPIKLLPVATRGTSDRVDARVTQYASDLSASVPFGKEATHALRVRATLSVGRTGRSPQRRIAGYALEGGVPIGVLNLTFQYGPPTVFDLPVMRPDYGWQVGTHGAFVRKTNILPKGDVVSMAYYSGGF